MNPPPNTFTDTLSTSDTVASAHRQEVDLTAWRRFRARYALSEPFVWLEVQTRLHARLDVLNVSPRSILDAAPRAGTGSLALVKRYPNALLVAHCASQFATLMLKGKYTGGLLQRLWNVYQKKPEARIAWAPVVPQGPYDLIVCNLALTWVNDPPTYFKFWAEQLAPGGVLLFSVLGPDTAASFKREAKRAGWDTPLTTDFVDMHDYGDMMVQAGLSTPVLDVERVQLTYRNAQALRLDCTGLMGNVHKGRLQSLSGKGRFKRLEQAIDQNAPFPLELEMVFGHAWKPLNAPDKKQAKVTTVDLEALKATLPSRK